MLSREQVYRYKRIICVIHKKHHLCEVVHKTFMGIGNPQAKKCTARLKSVSPDHEESRTSMFGMDSALEFLLPL